MSSKTAENEWEISQICRDRSQNSSYSGMNGRNQKDGQV